jgi:hypothetical protein
LRLLLGSTAGILAGGVGLTSLLVRSPLAEAAPGGAANRPFLMLTLGDSIMWGQGLPENVNFHDRSPFLPGFLF